MPPILGGLRRNGSNALLRDVRLRSSKKNLISFQRGTVCLGRKTGLLPSNYIRRNQQRCAVLKIVEVIRVPPPPVLERYEDRIWSAGVQERL